MKTIENITLSADRVKHLLDLGFNFGETIFVLYPKWEKDENGNIIFSDTYYVPFFDVDENVDKIIPTLTLEEILDMLPEDIIFEGNKCYLCFDKGRICYKDIKEGFLRVYYHFDVKDERLNSAYKMLEWLVYNDIFKNDSNGS